VLGAGDLPVHSSAMRSCKVTHAFFCGEARSEERPGRANPRQRAGAAAAACAVSRGTSAWIQACPAAVPRDATRVPDDHSEARERSLEAAPGPQAGLGRGCRGSSEISPGDLDFSSGRAESLADENVVCVISIIYGYKRDIIRARGGARPRLRFRARERHNLGE